MIALHGCRNLHGKPLEISTSEQKCNLDCTVQGTFTVPGFVGKAVLIFRKKERRKDRKKWKKNWRREREKKVEILVDK